MSSGTEEPYPQSRLPTQRRLGIPALPEAASGSAVHGAVLIADSLRRCVWANDAACALLCRPRQSVVGRRIDDFVRGGPPAIDHRWRALLSTGRASGWVVLVAPGGEVLRVHFSAIANVWPGLHLSVLDRAARANGRGPPAHAAGRPRSTQSRPGGARLARRSGQSGPNWDRAARVIAHELRSPLAAALIHIGIVERRAAEHTALDRRARASLLSLKHQIVDLERLIGRLLQLSSAEGVSLERKEDDLGRIIGRAVELLICIDPDARARVRTEIARGLRGFWDAAAVGQIVSNLLSNALKFGRPDQVHLRLERAPGGASLSVRDEGVGVAPGDLRRIFEPFVRGRRGRTNGGLGIGLWVVRELVAAHGGRIDLTSQPGAGATFRVFLSGSLPPASRRPSTAP